VALSSPSAPPQSAPQVSEPTTPIKPSEALRLGRLTHPVRIRGSMFSADGRGACAVGAIARGLGFESDHEVGSLTEALDAGEYVWYRGLPSDVANKVMILNDDRNWTDDQIVAWLREQDL
jgi:hypothetical protein